jgi:cell division protein FtsA
VARKNLVVGLDVGSTKISTIVGQLSEGAFDIIGVGKSPSSGLRKGMVSDIEETVSSISVSLEEAERMSGTPLQDAFVSIGGTGVVSQHSKGVIAVSRADGEISESDVARVIEAARAVPNSPNQEIIHVIPRGFTIDGQTGIKDPIGMSGIRLEVDALVISTSTSSVKNLTKCVNQSGIQINELVFSPLATAKFLLSKRQKEIGVILVDIGAATTNYAIYEEGDILTAGVIPIGSSHISNDIAIGLRINIDTAEIIKIKYGSAYPDKINEKEEIDLSKIDKTEDGRVNVKYVSEIIEARLNEIFQMVKEQLSEVGRDGMLPAGIILTGGGSKLDGLVDFAKDYLRLPAQVGVALPDLTGIVDKLADPVYATSIGLMTWGLESDSSVTRGPLDKVPAIGGFVDKAKNIFKQFMP